MAASTSMTAETPAVTATVAQEQAGRGHQERAEEEAEAGRCGSELDLLSSQLAYWKRLRDVVGGGGPSFSRVACLEAWKGFWMGFQANRAHGSMPR